MGKVFQSPPQDVRLMKHLVESHGVKPWQIEGRTPKREKLDQLHAYPHLSGEADHTHESLLGYGKLPESVV